jgi:hypothetical protein
MPSGSVVQGEVQQQQQQLLLSSIETVFWPHEHEHACLFDQHTPAAPQYVLCSWAAPWL